MINTMKKFSFEDELIKLIEATRFRNICQKLKEISVERDHRPSVVVLSDGTIYRAVFTGIVRIDYYASRKIERNVLYLNA